MKTPKWFERAYPGACSLLTGAVAFALLCFIRSPALVDRPVDRVLGATVDLGAIAVSFLAGALGLILALHQGPTGKWIESSGLRVMLIDYLWSALRFSASLCLVSLTGLVLDTFVIFNCYRAIVFMVLWPAWAAATAGTIASAHRALIILIALLRYDGKARE